MNKNYCVNCLKEVSEDTKQCECGGKRFVFFEEGDLIRVEEGFRCKCSNDEFTTTLHIDFSDKAVTNCVCTKCGTQIGIEDYYRTEEGINR